MFVIDVFKTILRFLGKFMIIGIIVASPHALIVGLIDSVTSDIAWLFDVPVMCAAFMIVSYRGRLKDKDTMEKYKHDQILTDKFYIFAESMRVLREEKYTLAKDAVAFYIMYIPAVIPVFSQVTYVPTRVMYFLLGVTFPILNMLVMLLVRKKWHKDYVEFRKEAKYQEFH